MLIFLAEKGRSDVLGRKAAVNFFFKPAVSIKKIRLGGLHSFNRGSHF